jgi:chaperonin cofactor prefoldin
MGMHMKISENQIRKIVREALDSDTSVSGYGMNPMSRSRSGMNLDAFDESPEMQIEALKDQLADAHARIAMLEKTIRDARLANQ